MRGSIEVMASKPLVYYHGAQRWEGPPELRPSRSAKVAVHGPGLYLTSNRRTAEKYAKGGGIVLRMELSPDLRLVSDVDIELSEMVAFVKGVERMRHKEHILADLHDYAKRRSRTSIPANVLGNLMNHYGVAYGKPGDALVRFYLAHGIDGDVVDYVFFSGMERDEKWLVLFNMDKILKYERSMPEARPRRSTRPRT